MFLDWLFIKQVTLESDLTVDELFSRLGNVIKTGTGHINNSKYSGFINGRQRTFDISKTASKFEYGHTKPSIKGKITNSPQGNTRLIKLEMSISYGKTIAIMALTIAAIIVLAYIVILSVNFFQPNNSFFPKIDGSFLLFGLLLSIINCTPLVVFHLKIDEAIGDLTFIFGAREVHED